MKILLTNDDGYSAPGILALYEALSPYHEVLLVAPDRERSAVSHAITLNEPMRLEKVRLYNDKEGYRLSGTPADCVKLGLFELCPQKPDLIISGINPGTNTGVNINYSGTVGAVREGAINKIPGIAVSVKKVGKMMDFKGIARFMVGFIEKFQGISLPPGTFLNINAPDIPIRESTPVRITRQAQNNVSEGFEKRLDPRNRDYYWYGEINRSDSEEGTDIHALSLSAISITAIKCDMTDYEVMNRMVDFRF
jgi:5'-nucleotidase